MILERASLTDGRYLNKELREVRNHSATWGKSTPGKEILGRVQGAGKKASVTEVE